MRTFPSLLRFVLTDRPTVLISLLTTQPSREIINFVKCPSS